MEIDDYIQEALVSSLSLGAYDTAFEIMKFAVKHNQIRDPNSLAIFSFLVGKRGLARQDAQSVTSAFSNLKYLALEEMKLACTNMALSQNNVGSAFFAAALDPNHDEPNPPFDCKFHETSTYLLWCYRSLTRFIHGQHNNEINNFHLSQTDLEELSKFPDLFAEFAVFYLNKMNQSGEAESFLRNLVDCQEEPSSINLLLAWKIAQTHLPKASLDFQIFLLKTLADQHPWHPDVILLCEMCYDEGLAITHDQAAYILETVICFLHTEDTPGLRQSTTTSSLLHRAWTLLAEALKFICLRNEDDDGELIGKLWHNNYRSHWWPQLHFRSRTTSSLLEKALVCYILESELHPFVAAVKRTKMGKSLLDDISELKKKKMILDFKVKAYCRRTTEEEEQTRRFSVKEEIETEEEEEEEKVPIDQVVEESEVQDRDLIREFNMLCSVSGYNLIDAGREVGLNKSTIKIRNLPIKEALKSSSKELKRKLRESEPEVRTSAMKRRSKVFRQLYFPLSLPNETGPAPGTDPAPERNDRQCRDGFEFLRSDDQDIVDFFRRTNRFEDAANRTNKQLWLDITRHLEGRENWIKVRNYVTTGFKLTNR